MPKRKITEVSDFRSSTSLFRKEEEVGLKLIIKAVSDPKFLFVQKFLKRDILDPLKELLLEKYSHSEILGYKPKKEDCLSRDQRLFLTKLKLILLNNDPNSEAPNCERYIDDFVSFLFYKATLDNGLELTLRPCHLKLKIKDEFFAAIADKEGRRGSELIWLIQEDKHRRTSTYKHGDVQIFCAIIAAYQKNYYDSETVHPEKIIGIKFIAEKVYFYSVSMSEDYLEELEKGLPTSDITMYKFPENGFDISTCEDRKKIFEHITSLYYWAMSVEE